METDIEDFGYTIDLERGVVVYDSGYTAVISNFLDEDGEDTDDLDEVCVIVFPIPDGMWMSVDLDDLDDDESYDTEELH